MDNNSTIPSQLGPASTIPSPLGPAEGLHRPSAPESASAVSRFLLIGAAIVAVLALLSHYAKG